MSLGNLWIKQKNKCILTFIPLCTIFSWKKNEEISLDCLFMCQEAHVGLGIIGKEGRAAAQASDFALAKFKLLRRTLLVHGHWFYVRVSFLGMENFTQFFFFFSGLGNWTSESEKLVTIALAT